MDYSPKPKRPAVQLILLGILLIVFPLGSFLYLRAGWNYQLDSRTEMEALGPVADLLNYPRPDSSIDIVFVSPATTNDSIAVALRSIHEAFDDNPVVRFVALGDVSANVFDDPGQLTFVPTSLRTLDGLDADARYSQRCETVPVAQRAYVVDVAGQVRRCYNLHRGDEAARLVEQVAFIIPRPKTEDVFLERKTEL